MANDVALDAGSTPTTHLSEVERVVDTFIAPSKTFTDILRSASWWLPCVLMILGSLVSAYVVQHQVGFVRATENQIHSSPKQEDALNQLPPDQRAARLATTAKVTGYFTYGAPFLLLIFFAVYALILWGAFNFILGAQTTFGQVFATCFYASLPYLLLNLLLILTLYFGGNAEAYDYKNPVGTNPAYYMTDAAPWLKSLLGRIDLIQLWTVALTVYGMAVIARKTIMQSAVVVLGLWLLATVLSVGSAAMFS